MPGFAGNTRGEPIKLYANILKKEVFEVSSKDGGCFRNCACVKQTIHSGKKTLREVAFSGEGGEMEE